MNEIEKEIWVPTPTFLYRNYVYKKIVNTLPKNTFFLEVGTGNGEFLKYLVSLGLKGDSIDFSKTVITHLNNQKNMFNGVSIKRGDILKYKSNKKYDAVLCFELLEHIKDDMKAIKNISQLLRRNGLFFFSVPAHQKDWGNIDKIKGHIRRYEKEEIKYKLRKNGFSSIKILNYGFPFLNIVRKISKGGSFIESPKIYLKKEVRTGLSSLRQEYNPKWKWLVANQVLLKPFFIIMDLFLNFDIGFGYIVTAKKSKEY